MKRRFGVMALVALASLVSFLAGAFVTSDVISRAMSRKIHSRQAYWTSILSREVRIGEPKSEVEAWIVRHSRPEVRVFHDTYQPDDHYDPSAREFFVVTDRIDDPVGSPCGAWRVALEVSLGPDDRVVSRDVRTRGTCL